VAEISSLPSSYAGLMVRIAHDADQLRVHGEALKKMGAAAPACLAEPYMRERQKMIEAGELLFDAFRREHGDAAYAKLAEHAAGFLRTLDDMPDGIAAGPDLGPNWRPEAFGDAVVIPGGLGGQKGNAAWSGTVSDRYSRRGGLRKLSADPFESFIFTGASRAAPEGALPAALKATEAVARFTFWRGLGATGGAILTFAAKRALPVFFIIMTAKDILTGPGLADTLRGMLESRGNEAAAGIMGRVAETLARFEDDYLARTVQQWQAVIKIAREANGSVELMRAMMQQYDPHNEKPLPPSPAAWDAFMISELAKIQVRRPKKYNWIGLSILGGGVALAAYGLGG
jgi:hypothetical protein